MNLLTNNIVILQTDNIIICYVCQTSLSAKKLVIRKNLIDKIQIPEKIIQTQNYRVRYFVRSQNKIL